MFSSQISKIIRGKNCFKCRDVIIRTGCIIATVNNNIVMIKDNDRLSFPGGTCEPGDKNIFDTAIREFYEESIIGDNFDGSTISNWDEISTKSQSNPETPVEYLLNYFYKNLPLSSFWIGGNGLTTCYFQIQIPYYLHQSIHPMYTFLIPKTDFKHHIYYKEEKYVLRKRELIFMSGLYKFIKTDVSFSGTFCKHINADELKFQCDIFQAWCFILNPDISNRHKYRINICAKFIPILKNGSRDMIQQIYDFSYKIGFKNLRICKFILSDCDVSGNFPEHLPEENLEVAKILKKTYMSLY